MSKCFGVVAAGVMSLTLVACGSRQQQAPRQDQEVIEERLDNGRGHEVKSLRPRVVDQTVRLRNSDYKIHISREVDAALPTVKTEEGEVYMDNRIALKIEEAGGRLLLDKVFTKQQFAAFVEPKFMEKAILDGLAFDKVSDSGFLFVAGISYPQSDLYIPVSVHVGSNGKVSLSKGELMDEDYME